MTPCKEGGCRYPAIRHGRCYMHAELASERYAAEKVRRRIVRRCTQCGVGVERGVQTCDDCKAKDNRRARLRYWQLRQIGVCVRCALVAGDPFCGPCRKARYANQSPEAKARRTAESRKRARRLMAAKPEGACSAVTCKAEATHGKLCDHHWELKEARKQRWRDEGLCSQCGAVPEEGKTCRHCRQIQRTWYQKSKRKRKAQRKRNYHARVDAGICRRHGCGRPQAPGKKSCQECIDDEANTKAKRREAGLCPNCGIRKPAENRATCRVCLDRTSRSNKKRRAREARDRARKR